MPVASPTPLSRVCLTVQNYGLHCISAQLLRLYPSKPARTEKATVSMRKPNLPSMPIQTSETQATNALYLQNHGASAQREDQDADQTGQDERGSAERRGALAC